MSEPMSISVVRGIEIDPRQGKIPYFVGVSDRTVGAKCLSMQLVVLPPGGGCIPHLHVGSESALYIMSGNARTRYGNDLEYEVDAGPGDFIFIPPGVPHQGQNLSETESVIAIVARNDSKEQENIQLHSEFVL